MDSRKNRMWPWLWFNQPKPAVRFLPQHGSRLWPLHSRWLLWVGGGQCGAHPSLYGLWSWPLSAPVRGDVLCCMRSWKISGWEWPVVLCSMPFRQICQLLGYDILWKMWQWNSLDDKSPCEGGRCRWWKRWRREVDWDRGSSFSRSMPLCGGMVFVPSPSIGPGVGPFDVQRVQQWHQMRRRRTSASPGLFFQPKGAWKCLQVLQLQWTLSRWFAWHLCFREGYKQRRLWTVFTWFAREGCWMRALWWSWLLHFGPPRLLLLPQ